MIIDRLSGQFVTRHFRQFTPLNTRVIKPQNSINDVTERMPAVAFVVHSLLNNLPLRVRQGLKRFVHILIVEELQDTDGFSFLSYSKHTFSFERW